MLIVTDEEERARANLCTFLYAVGSVYDPDLARDRRHWLRGEKKAPQNTTNSIPE